MVNLSLHYFIAVFLTALLFFTSSWSADERSNLVNLGGDWTQVKIEVLLQQSTGGDSTPGQKVDLISSAFLGTPYLAGTLIGRVDLSEIGDSF